MKNQTKNQSSILTGVVHQKIGAIYCRVSTDEQAESGTSIELQKSKGLAYAESQDIHVPENYIFLEDYSGKTLDRPQLSKLRAIIQARKIDSLIVLKPNRLDRSEWGINLLLILQELKAFGVELHYSQDGRFVDLNNPLEALLQSIGGWQAGEDHRDTVEKLHRGKLAHVAQNNSTMAMGRPPYGYQECERKEGRKTIRYFKINETEAEVVRNIFRWYVLGDEAGKPLSITKIAEKLTDLAIPKKSETDPRYKTFEEPVAKRWPVNTVGAILKNQTYIGLWRYNKTNHKRKTDYNLDSSIITVEVPAIVDKDLWNMAQERRAKRQKNPGNNKKYNYLIGGMVRCSCGYTARGKTQKSESKSKSHKPGKLYQYYVCVLNGNANYDEKCTMPFFKAGVVEHAIWQGLREIIEDEEKLRAGLAGYRAKQQKELTPLEYDLKLVSSEAAEIETHLEQAINDFRIARSARHKALIASDIERLENQLDGLQALQTELQERMAATGGSEEEIASLVHFFSLIRNDLETIEKDFESKRLLLERLNIQVTLAVDEDGRKKAVVSGKIIPNELFLFLDSIGISRPSLQRKMALHFYFIADLEPTSKKLS